MSLQFMQSIQENKRVIPRGPLFKTSKELKPSTTSRIPVFQRCKIKPLLKRENREISSTQKGMSVIRGEFRSCLKTSNSKPDICKVKEGHTSKVKELEDREKLGDTSDVFVWKTEKAAGKKSENNDKLLWMMQCPRPNSTDSDVRQGQWQKLRTVKAKIGPEIDLEVTMNGKAVNTMWQPSSLYYNPTGDHVTFGNPPSAKEKGGLPTVLSPKIVNGLKNQNEENEKDKYKRYVRHEIGEKLPDISQNISNLQNENEKERDENTKLRGQIEKLSCFVETSEELRERSELLLTQQRKELEKEIREKDVLKNKVACLEELRRNLKLNLDKEIEENNSLKNSMMDIKARLSEEKENVTAIKKERSLEISKNVELELVLQTVLEELSNANKLLNRRENGELDRLEGKVPSQVATRKWRNGFEYAKYSVHHNASNDENWNREKIQFEGKIKLLEMDKTRLRSHIDSLEERIIEHERIGYKLREHNDVLEFRISELECQLSELNRRN